MAIRQACLEPLALGASGHERMVYGPTAASEEERIDLSAGIAWFGEILSNDSADWLRQEIKRITGVEVREAKAEIETTTGTVVQVFTTGTVVQVFLLASGIPAVTWNGSGIVKSS